MTDVTDFKQTYCESRGIAPHAFEKNFLKEVFHTPGKPLALLLLLLRPSVFREELALITHIGSTVEFESFADRRNKLIDHTLYQIAPWRKAVGIRASGRKLFQIGNTVNSAAFRD